jgi:hypothetical protein
MVENARECVYNRYKRIDSGRTTIANGRVLVEEDVEDLPSLARALESLAAWACRRRRARMTATRGATPGGPADGESCIRRRTLTRWTRPPRGPPHMRAKTIANA